MPQLEDPLRRPAVLAMRRGHLTASEIAHMIGTSPQKVAYWARRARVDARAARDKYIAGVWVDAVRAARRLSP